MQPIPVSLITGFLGSGKTTLLSRLLKQQYKTKIAVIINEFGEIGLDHHLVERVSEEIMLLRSGCLCCTVRTDLLQSATHDEAHAHAHHHDVNRHDDHIRAFCFTYEKHLPSKTVDMWLKQLMDLRGSDFLRIKGIVNSAIPGLKNSYLILAS